MKNTATNFLAVMIAAFSLTGIPAFASQSTLDLSGEADDVTIGKKEFSPNLDRGYPQRVFWGDTHVHTSYSTDAGMFGNRLGPDEAYRFARGEEVTSSTGVRTKLLQPLDWLVVADHAENLGLATMITESNPELLRIPWGKKVHDMVKAGKPGDAYATWGEAMQAGKDPLADKALEKTMWERITSYAEEFNNPGVFTAMIGFEWTSSPGGNNLHRNVIYRDDKTRADLILPLSNYDTSNPEELWQWMERYEEKSGGRMLALAHNGNLSNGLMFDDVTFDGKPLDRGYAEQRIRWEPLYEVTQMKGDGEAHPSLSPNDEFADYGIWDKGSFGSAKEPGMIPKEYAREALKKGLRFEEKIGANPFKFGMVGSTDTHTSLSTTEENNFFGKAVPAEPSASPDRFDEQITGFLPDPKGRDYTIHHFKSLSAGLAAVWATGNTRHEIWDAMKRKEVYATTGTRMTVRVFAGWDFVQDDVQRPDFARDGYTRGVPMGGDLSTAPDGKAPTFVIRALRDPDGANLDRIQIIKGWLDAKGKTHEKVHDVTWSDDRIPDSKGTLPPVGNTVDIQTATYTNSIGEAVLMGFWKDSEFNPKERAVYYVRVLEIPTPRWTTYDAAFFGVELPAEVEPTHQERGYTSPIWYTP